VSDDAKLTIAGGDLQATFLPEVGFLGVSLRHEGTEILALPGGVDRYRAGHATGLPLLAPWANRLAQRRYSIAGVDVDLEGLRLHEDPNGLPIHGTMTAQPGWDVTARDDSSVRATFQFDERPDLLASFPFPHELTLDVDLADGALHVVTSIQPTANVSVPVSFGWHPYFALPGSRTGTRLRLPQCEHALLDDRGIPTGDTEPQPQESEPLADRSFDDLYLLAVDRTLALETLGGRSVSMTLDEGYSCAQVYSPADAAFACLEPMTAPTNALVTGECPLVAPGESFVARFSVTPTRA